MTNPKRSEKQFNITPRMLLIALLVMITTVTCAQLDTAVYHLELNEETVVKAGKEVQGITINGGIPGPTLRFKEGGYAVIYVKNNMDVETSVHWHGLLLPNFFDGVPYLTTPPIEPGQTQKYEFPLRQAGTYWYHSHTMLQEQSGQYGSIVIEPKEDTLDYNKELVLVLSDWTNENPMSVLRFLKRGTEWYNWRKGTATPLNQVIARGALKAQMNFWKQRMEGADIADIYYPAFLANGQQLAEYPEFDPGDKVRVRIINASASSNFWLTFGGEAPSLVSADGIDVVPVKRSKSFIAIAETYDFILTIPDSARVEIRAMAQDGSGSSSTFLGKGPDLNAEVLPRPDKIGMMMKMAEMDMKMGAPSHKLNPNKVDPHEMMHEWGMQMDMEPMKSDHEMHGDMNMDHQEQMMFAEYNYDYLRSAEKTSYPEDAPVREILLNLTGNMSRYIWSLNGVPLSETDKILVKENQVTRITLNNLTMMHHPMHLHGHFFRVINKHGDYSPLKHTVNVPPMQKITIEFYGSEYGDWFFHCHVLYHMISGMARIFSYDTPRDPRMVDHPVSKLIHETNRYYSWGTVEAASQFTGVQLVSSNIRNQFNLGAEFGYNKNFEAELTYERYLYDYVRIFAGVNVENETPRSFDGYKPTGVFGVRWFTPYMFMLDARLDNELRTRISLEREVMIFPRFSVFGYYEYLIDFGVVNSFGPERNYGSEVVWKSGASFLLSKNISLFALYDNRFGGGGGVSVRF